MKTFYNLFIATIAILLFSCSNGQMQNAKTNLSANEFDLKIKELSSAIILDVRTSGEFAKGHLPNAKNFDWNGNNFENQVAMLDKEKPVFVYCLSGARSSAAATKMRSEGFKEVYQLDGGIMKWRGANLPETTDNASANTGINMQQFEELLSSDKLVLVDFYADWCEPCKIMKPYLDEISKNMANRVTLVRINADDNQKLCKELNIDALPVLLLYKNKALAWTHTGYLEKADVIKHLQ
ncbi:MAG: thioredoxin [Bacteroidia bacterium]|nr:thioredoxin [Bacteroidia bacterium]